MRKNNKCFQLLFYPEKDNYLKEFIEGSIEIIEKKYNIDNPPIKRIFGLLLTIPDNDARHFMFFFVLYWEDKIARALEETLETTEEKQHFRKFVNKMSEYINKTTKFPYDKNNIIEIVNEFVKSAKLEYPMGPF